jgi:hypothetical protein
LSNRKASGSKIFAMTNGSANVLWVSRIALSAGFDGSGITFEPAMVQLACQRQVGAAKLLALDWPLRCDTLRLEANEGLAIDLQVAAVVGDHLCGYVEWFE